MLRLFGDVRFVSWTVQHVATPAELLQMMVLESQFRIGAGLDVRTETHRLVLQLRKFRISVTVVVVAAPFAVLTEKRQPHLLVIRHQRGVHHRIVLEHVQTADSGQRV